MILLRAKPQIYAEIDPKSIQKIQNCTLQAIWDLTQGAAGVMIAEAKRTYRLLDDAARQSAPDLHGHLAQVIGETLALSVKPWSCSLPPALSFTRRSEQLASLDVERYEYHHPNSRVGCN